MDFEYSLEPASGLERRLRVQLPATHVEREVQSRLKSAGSTVRLKGFRPGKVPVHVVQQRFGPQIRQEVVQDLVQTSWSEAISRAQLQPAGAPKIEMGAAGEGQDLVYTAVFEVYPEFKVAGLETLSIERPETTVADTDIDQTIERLRTQRATWTPVARPSARGDRVVIDFSGTRSGEPVAGGCGERVGLVIGEGRMFADFEAALVGHAAGADTTFTVTFPADYHEASLRGAQVSFAVHVHEVAERQLPAVDEEFIRSFEVASGDMGEFRRLVRENLEREAAARIQGEVRRQVFDALLAANPVEVPAALVNREAAALQADAMRKAGIQNPADAPALSAFEEVGRRRARLALIMRALIEENGLKVDPVRVNQRLDEFCAAYDRPEEARRLYIQNSNLMTQIESSVLEEQLIAWLLERIKVTPKPVGFAVLMGV